ncbi:MAG: Unknown protein [uncultured Sulfurovum sp.]|uniref:Rhodanese domain-containing protein n=1 Tax=uncultured Sulfurovum sp. TaxID=269237 RepID=A0A6S6U248_9BACT|nr:MAG: Unknown protein [uncultured Sulfurovum sp.]
MQNKFVWIPLVSLVFLGCTKTIIIGNNEQRIEEAPVTYYEEVPIYGTGSGYEINTVNNNVPYSSEPVVSQSKSFNISPLEAFDKMQDNQNVLLLDVRMVHEIPQDGKIADSVMIPLQVLGSNLHRLDKSKEIIVYCHVGNRSVEATQLLQSQGFDAVNMSGGIEEWKRNHLAVRWK